MTKECPYCKSQVRNDVAKCPVCREWILKWSKGGPYLATAIFFSILVLYFVGLEVLKKDLFSASGISASTSNEKKSLQIVSSEKVKIGDSIAIIGEVKNLETSPIEMLSIEGTFYDKSKKIVNTGSDYISGKIASGETRPFKITFDCGKPGSDYTNYETYTLTFH